MAADPISSLPPLAIAATGDLMAIVDISEATIANRTKHITIADLPFLKSGDNVSELTNDAGYKTVSDFSNNGEAATANRDLGNTDAFGLSFITDGVGRINILSTGEVGIGTSTPTEKVEIVGGLKVDAFFVNSLYVSNSAAFVGLGTTAPFTTEKLGVQGGIRCTANSAIGASPITNTRLYVNTVRSSAGKGMLISTGNSTDPVAKGIQLSAGSRAGVTTSLHGIHLTDLSAGDENITAYGSYFTVRTTSTTATGQTNYGAFFDTFAQPGIGNTAVADLTGVYSVIRAANGDGNGIWRGGVFGVNTAGYVGTDAASLELIHPTEDTLIIDSGSAAATEQDWIEVKVGGVTGYIRVYATK